MIGGLLHKFVIYSEALGTRWFLELGISLICFSEPKGVIHFLYSFGSEVCRRAGIGSNHTWNCWLPYRSMSSFLNSPPLHQLLINCCTAGFHWLLTEIFSVSEHKGFMRPARQGFCWGGQAGNHPVFPSLVASCWGSRCFACTWQIISHVHVHMGLDGRETAGLVNSCLMPRSS